MKRRIWALILAASLISTLFLSSCGKNDSELLGTESSETESAAESQEESLPDTDRDLFLSAVLDKIDFSEIEFPALPTPPASEGDTKIGTELTVSSLKADGNELCNDDFGISGILQTDFDKQMQDFSFSFNIEGKEFEMRFLLDDKEIYLTDFLGLTKKYYKLTELLGLEIVETEEIANIPQDVIEKASSALLRAIASNVDDSAFSSKVKNITVNGTEYKDANVITLTLNGDVLYRIADDWLHELKVNGSFDSLFTDASKESFKSAIERIKKLTITCNTANGKCVSLSFESPIVKLDDKGQELAKKTNSGEIIFTENGFDLQIKLFGIAGENFEDYTKFEIKHENIDNRRKISIVRSGLFDAPRKIFDANFILNSEKLEGDFGFFNDKQALTFKLCLKGGNDIAELSLTDFKRTLNGEDTNDKLNLNLTLQATEAKYDISADFEFATNVADMLTEVVGTAAITAEYCDVDIANPSPLGTLEEFENVLQTAAALYEDSFNNEDLLVFLLELFGSVDLNTEYRSNRGISITLPADFEEENYDENVVGVLWYDYNTSILAYRASRSGLRSVPPQEYLKAIREHAGYENPSPIKESNGIFYFELDYINNYGQNASCLVTVYASDSHFWTIELCAQEDYYDLMFEDYLKWLKTVKVFTPASSDSPDVDL